MTPEQTKEFILAGKAQFTLSNGRGNKFAYRVDRKAGLRGIAYFLSLDSALKGGRNKTYIGLIDAHSGRLIHTPRSRFGGSDPEFVAAAWALQHVWAGKPLPSPASLDHVGRCGRCGRQLTNPESILLGMGSECRAR